MRRPVETTPATRLRQLARAVERLAVTGRLDPAKIYEAKAEVAQQLRRLAAELERVA